jgi:3-hydroxyisobutyrate dehydrogenase-like beta-hydroxyacid dehydrogenase
MIKRIMQGFHLGDQQMSDSHRAKTIAIVGAGEMGAAVGQRLRESGARAVTTLKGRGAASVARVRDANLEIVDDDDVLVTESAIILSIVPPGEAIAVAERFRGPLMRAALKPIFVDCNAVSPATVRRIADSLARTGCGFIDAGIIGGPPRPGGKGTGPRFYASGEAAHELTKLRDFGLDVAVVEGGIGAASALKMSYAGLTKGLIAVGATMFGAASRTGLASALREELARSQPQLLAMLTAMIPRMYSKAYRWVSEMEQIAEFVGGDETGGAIYMGAARLYEQLAADFEQDRDAGESIAVLNSFCRGGIQS